MPVGAGNDFDNTMTRTVTVPAGTATMDLQARYHIETCWDYAYLQVSTDGGANFTNINTSVSTTDNENGQNFGFGITGVSGAPKVCDDLSATPAWVPVTADLSAYAGQTIQIRFRYPGGSSEPTLPTSSPTKPSGPSPSIEIPPPI